MADPVFLQRVVPAPLQSEQFSADFNAWLATLVDQINSTIAEIETALNTP